MPEYPQIKLGLHGQQDKKYKSFPHNMQANHF